MQGEEADQPDEEPQEQRWRDTWREIRSEDRFAQALAEALKPDENPSEPPPRRTPTRPGTWLKRSKLWDDVFTRTLANVLSVAILAGLAGLAGVIDLDRRAWAVGAFLGIVAVGLLVVNVYPVRYLKRQPFRWLVLAGFIVVAIAFSFILFAPYLPGPSSERCPDVDMFC